MLVRLVFGLLTTLLFCEGVAFGQSNPNVEMTTIAYPVGDLVIPINAARDAEKIATSEAELMARILKTVASASWDRAGGAGSMRFEAKGGYLLHVHQTPAVHAELKTFLEKLQRGQVSIEVRILSVSEIPLESRGLKWIENDGIEHALFDDAKLFRFLRAAEGDQTTHIMQLPKLTIFDGQDAKMEAIDWMTFQTGADVQIKEGKPVVVPKDEKFFVGTKTRFLPTISADRKHVTVQAEIVMRNLISESRGVAQVPVSLPIPSPFDGAGKPAMKEIATFVQQPSFNEIKLAIAAKVPDQRTIALKGGKVLAEGRNEFGPPILSKIPYLSRLFRNQAFGRETKTVIIFLTPRIIGEPETVHVEQLRNGIQVEDDGQFPMILSQSGR